MSFEDLFGKELPGKVERSIKARIGHVIQQCIDKKVVDAEGIENYYLKAVALGVRELLVKEGRTEEQAKEDVTIDKLRAYFVLKLDEKPRIREKVSHEILDHYGVRIPTASD